MADQQSTMRKGNTNEITVAPSLVDMDLTNTYDVLYNTDNTTISTVFPSDVVSQSEVEAAIEYRNAFKQGDAITAITKYYDSLNSNYFKQADFSLENILFWYQKLKLSNKEIFSYRSEASFNRDNILSNQLPGAALQINNALDSANISSVLNGGGGNNNNTSYFDVISDSIGIVANSKYCQLDSTLPLFDINQEYYGVPIPYSASIESKMSASARNVAYDLSLKTTSLMRHNLLGVGYSNLTLQTNMQADASTSHGLNLINDLPTFVTINESLSLLKDKLTSVFSDAKTLSFIQYLSNIANDVAYNLRDIFPVSESDKDFVIVTSAERAQASQAIAQQEADNAKAEQALYAQQQGWEYANNARYNSNIGARPYTATGAAPQPGDPAALNYDPNTAPAPITADMIEGTGQVTERNVSTYGSYKSDLTTFLDIKPPRPQDGIDYWENRGVNIATAEQNMYHNYPNWKPTLSIEDTTRGAYVGSKLTANFDVAVSKSYGYPPGTLLKITDASGKPVGSELGNKDGIFRVGDTGGGSLAKRNALDFYTGNDPAVAKYYSKLDSKGSGLKVEVVKLKA